MLKIKLIILFILLLGVPCISFGEILIYADNNDEISILNEEGNLIKKILPDKGWVLPIWFGDEELSPNHQKIFIVYTDGTTGVPGIYGERQYKKFVLKVFDLQANEFQTVWESEAPFEADWCFDSRHIILRSMLPKDGKLPDKWHSLISSDPEFIRIYNHFNSNHRDTLYLIDTKTGGNKILTKDIKDYIFHYCLDPLEPNNVYFTTVSIDAIPEEIINANPPVSYALDPMQPYNPYLFNGKESFYILKSLFRVNLLTGEKTEDTLRRNWLSSTGAELESSEKTFFLSKGIGYILSAETGKNNKRNYSLEKWIPGSLKPKKMIRWGFVDPFAGEYELTMENWKISNNGKLLAGNIGNNIYLLHLQTRKADAVYLAPHDSVKKGYATFMGFSADSKMIYFRCNKMGEIDTYKYDIPAKQLTILNKE